MNNLLLGVAFAAAMAGSVAWGADRAAAPADPSQATAPAFDKFYFLRAAEEAAKAGDKEAAVQLYQSAIIYGPADPVPYERLASLYAANGQIELAQQYFNLALDAQPAYAPALQGLAMLQLAAGNRAAAQASHDILLRSCGATCPETAKVGEALNGN